jgi:small subunit ribosomal protein S20
VKTTRNIIKKLRTTTNKAEAQELYKKAASMVDRLAKSGVIHKNNASNKKSKLAKYVNHLS